MRRSCSGGKRNGYVQEYSITSHSSSGQGCGWRLLQYSSGRG